MSNLFLVPSVSSNDEIDPAAEAHFRRKMGNQWMDQLKNQLADGARQIALERDMAQNPNDFVIIGSTVYRRAK